jgi:hypothetical protein
MKKRYSVKKVNGSYALMDGDKQLYVTTQKIARQDAAAFNKAAEQNMHLTGGIHPLVEFLSDPDKFSASEQNPIPPTRK